MALVRNILFVMGGPESPSGTAAALDTVIPVRSLPGLDKTVTKQEDPAIVGARMPIGQYLTQSDVAGPLPLAPRAGKAVGKFLKSGLGLESAPVQVGACIRIKYSGASASAKLSVDSSGDDLLSAIGVLGAEAPDAAFGTAGTIDLTASGEDTVGELVAAIDAYADYQCEKVWGADSVLSSKAIAMVAVQGKDKWAYLWFTSTTSGAYMRKYTLDLTSGELPTYTIQGEGYEMQRLYNGVVTDTIALNGALGGFVDMDVGLLGFEEDATAGASGLSVANLEKRQPLIYQDGDTTIGDDHLAVISSLKLMLDNKSNKQGYGQGSLSRSYQQKGEVSISIDLQTRLDSTTKAYRTRKFDGTMLAASFRYIGAAIGAAANNLFEALLVETPYVNLKDYKFVERNKVIDAQITGTLLNPGAGNYDVPLTITMVSPDSAAF